jgi:predicted HAD superfamily phosphohydrolase
MFGLCDWYKIMDINDARILFENLFRYDDISRCQWRRDDYENLTTQKLWEAFQQMVKIIPTDKPKLLKIVEKQRDKAIRQECIDDKYARGYKSGLIKAYDNIIDELK